MRSDVCLGLIVSVAMTLGACSPAAPTAVPAKQPTSASAATASAAPTQAATAPASPTAVAKPATPTPASKVKRGGTLNVASFQETPTWDPIFSNPPKMVRDIPVFETLIDYMLIDSKTGKHELKPSLAESWNLTDPTTVVLKLRKGVKFHDGSEFNAEVAKWNLERARDHPKSVAKRLVEEVASIETPDPLTLRLKLKQPSGLILTSLTSARGGTGDTGTMMVSKVAFDSKGEEFIGSKPPGTGPMQIADWKRDDRLAAQRWDGYWQSGEDGKPLPYLDGMTARIIKDPSVIFMELRAGTVDISSHLAESDFAAAKGNPDLQVQLLNWSADFHVIAFNPKGEPWASNKKLRQAALHAIDRQSLASAVGFGLAEANDYLFWGPGMLGYDASLPTYKFDLEKGRQLLKEAGYPDGLDVAYIAYSGSAFQKPAEVVQAMWAKVGIKAQLEISEMLAARARIKLGNYDLTSHRATTSLDPEDYARMFICNGPANFSEYCNPEVDKCMAEGAKTFDSAERDRIYKRCQAPLYEDALIGGLHRIFPYVAHRKTVNGVGIQYGHMDLRSVWLDK